MDGDLQNNPEDVPMMLDTLEKKDCDIVSGIRMNRRDAVLSKKLPSRIANFFIRLITGVKLRDYGCSLRVFREDIARNLELYGELHRFILHGKSKYGFGRTFRVMSDLLLMVFFKHYKNRPIHLFGTLGIITFVAGAVIDLYLLLLKLLGNDIWGKPLLLLGIMLTIGGIQIITIGIIAEMLMRTYYESQYKKTYRIKRTVQRES